MKKWPKQHQGLFALLLIALILCGVGYFLLVRPLEAKIRFDQEFIFETKTKLKQSDWPLDSERLQKLLEYKKSILNQAKASESAYKATGLKSKSTLLLQECTNVFNKRIKKIFVNPGDFAKEITRLDYQDEYNTVRDKLAKRNIYFSEESLKIGDDAETEKIYPLVLQIWLVDEIVQLALKNSLRVANDEHAKVKNEFGRLKQVARIQLLPVQPYVLYDNDKQIYVVEFPLRISLRGNLIEFSSFLRDLHSGGKYFPLSRIQIKARPDWRDEDSKTVLDNKELEIEIECSAFFRYSEAVPVILEKKKIKLIPNGA